MNYREKIREQINKYPYGEYYGLKPNQPKDIIRLLDEMDGADKFIKHQFFEIERLNNIINELENGLKEEIDRLEKVALENKNNKFEFDKLVSVIGKVRDIYDELKELKEGK